MAKPTTTRAFTLPDSHITVLEMLAQRMGLTVDQALAQAIRVYQMDCDGHRTDEKSKTPWRGFGSALAQRKDNT